MASSTAAPSASEMPQLARPDGVEIHWEERGSGPTVIFADQFFGHPGVFAGIKDDLATDHRLITYDPRGSGRSTREGPYTVPSDAEDLAALVDEVGGASVLIGIGDGCNRAVLTATQRKDLVEAVFTPAGSPLSRARFSGGEGLAASDGVVDALGQLLSTDYKAALHSIVSSMNPDLSADELRERIDGTVEYAPQEQAVGRLSSWLETDCLDEALELGDRMWISLFPDNPWFSRDSLDLAHELLPEAHIVELHEGPVSHPAGVTKLVRELVSTHATR